MVALSGSGLSSACGIAATCSPGTNCGTSGADDIWNNARMISTSKSPPAPPIRIGHPMIEAEAESPFSAEDWLRR